ncbi:site-specific integrase [Nocardia australiensis]|uniref:site-specific integrase n=1 Tax=Nocardia australiensis TaxID=2887191 RepID=UPI001D13D911|nr:site-specific integrase [Nocardia australiensis]
MPKPVGAFGQPSKPKKQKNGTWRTAVRFYGAWGTQYLERFGDTAGEARNRLAEAMRDHREQLGYSRITRTTKLIDLAAELIAELEGDEAFTDGNIEDYRREIYVSTDKRANPNTIKIENSIGHLQVWQATAGELDRHLKHLIALGLRRKAKQHKIILRAMMGIAVRHGAIDTKPIDGVAGFTRRKTQSRGKVKDQHALPAFRAQVRAWANGEEIPGTPAYKSGPARDWSMVWVVDVITGTGMRPHEVFALLLEDINLDAPDPTWTLVETKSKGTGGWIRNPAPKTDNGWRRILLPPHSVESLREAIEDLETSGRPNPMGLLFPSRAGTLRNPNNFGRIWRAARGSEFNWVTPRTFRKGAGTEIDHASGDPERAARQLGNTKAVALATTSTCRKPCPTIGTCSSAGHGVPSAKSVGFLWGHIESRTLTEVRKPLPTEVRMGFFVGMTGFEPATT